MLDRTANIYSDHEDGTNESLVKDDYQMISH